MSEKEVPGENSRHATIIAFEIAVGLAAAGIAGVAARRAIKHHPNLVEHIPHLTDRIPSRSAHQKDVTFAGNRDPALREQYIAKLSIFSNERINADDRQMMARVAARIFLVTNNKVYDDQPGGVPFGALVAEVGEDRQLVNKALHYLRRRDVDLVGLRSLPGKARRRGYIATEALMWAGLNDDPAVAPELNIEIASLLGKSLDAAQQGWYVDEGFDS
jgi:hypothetical protein